MAFSKYPWYMVYRPSLVDIPGYPALHWSLNYNLIRVTIQFRCEKLSCLRVVVDARPGHAAA